LLSNNMFSSFKNPFLEKRMQRYISQTEQKNYFQ
jgi:hypothetical protein